jgi:hypothetical protein
VNPYLFVVGCPRSGTTLLRRMLGAHPRVAMTRETHWIPKLAKRAGSKERVTAELLAELYAHPKFENLALPRRDVERAAAGYRPYATFVAALFDRYGERTGKPLVGDKTPGYVRAIPLLHKLFPQTRFVHLIRDGRDVCLSALGWERKQADFRRRLPTWADAPVTTCALWWRWHVLLGRRDGHDLPPGLYREVRYEALVADPETELRALCTFLEIEYDDAMARYHEGRGRNKHELSAKKAWLPPTVGLRNWRAQMAEADVAQFEAAAGDALVELGYERAGPPPTRRRLAAVAAAAETFPRVRLPEGW